MNGAVFIDRDGTLIKEVNYLSSLEQLDIFEYSFDALKVFNNLKLRVIVITNQSGIARGYFNKEFVEATHNLIAKTVKNRGCVIDDFFYCPHLPENNCKCRKPKIGMIEKAVEKYGMDLKKSFFIGDSVKDVDTGINAGVLPIQVLTGYGRELTHPGSMVTVNIYTASLLIKNLVL